MLAMLVVLLCCSGGVVKAMKRKRFDVTISVASQNGIRRITKTHAVTVPGFVSFEQFSEGVLSGFDNGWVEELEGMMEAARPREVDDEEFEGPSEVDVDEAEEQHASCSACSSTARPMPKPMPKPSLPHQPESPPTYAHWLVARSRLEDWSSWNDWYLRGDWSAKAMATRTRYPWRKEQ
jgi:hypothetical protein